MTDCICVTSGNGPEGCGICNETGVRRTPPVSPSPSDLDGAVDRVTAERDTAQSAVEAWAHVCESLEAHLEDRVAMGDEANPEVYLRILRSNMARVQKDSEQIRASRWADYRRQREQIEALESALSEAREQARLDGKCLRQTRERLQSWPLDDHETCMCGALIKIHNVGSGHSPVSQGDHAISLMVEEITARLATRKGETA